MSLPQSLVSCASYVFSRKCLVSAMTACLPLGLSAANYDWLSGDGFWSTTQPFWNVSGAPGPWLAGNAARFGFIGGAPQGGNVWVSANIAGVQDLKFGNLSTEASHYRLMSDPATRGANPFQVTLTSSELTLESSAYGVIEDLVLYRAGSLNVRGNLGGNLVLEDGSQISATSYISVMGGATLSVKTGAEINSGDTFIVGTTVSNGVSGAGQLIVDGGVVRAGTGATGSRNFILGNRSNQAGDVGVTLKSGEIVIHDSASSGLAFENADTKVGENVVASNAVFNLDGGTLSARRILSANNTGNPNTSFSGETVFNFNGGTWKIVNPFADGNITNADRIRYVVKAGGARIDTNGFDVTSRAVFRTDASLGAVLDGGLVKLGAGRLILAADNLFTGALDIRGGSVAAFTNNRVGSASKIMIRNGAAFENTTDSYELTASRSLELEGNASLHVNGSATLTFKGAISNIAGEVGRLVKSGTGTLDLRDGLQSQYSGGIWIQGGTLRTNSVRQLGSTTGTISIDGGTFDHQISEVVTNNFVIGSNGAKIMGSAWNGRGIFTGSGHLQVQGTVVLGGKNFELASSIEVLAGSNLGLRQATAMGTATGGMTLRDNAVLRLDHNGVGGSGYDADDRFYKDALVMQSGSHLMSLGRQSANDTQAKNGVYQGNISLGEGALARFTVFNQNSTYASAVVPDLEIEGQVSGLGGLDKLGVGRLVLKSSNTYTGKTQVSAGSLELKHADAVRNSAWIQVSSGAELLVGNLPQMEFRHQVVSGEGWMMGSFILGEGAQLRPGSNAVSRDVEVAGSYLGTLEFGGDLRLSNTETPAIRFQIGEDVSDRVLIAGTLTVDPGVKFQVEWSGTPSSAEAEYQLMDWQQVNSWGQFDVAQQLVLPTLDFLPGAFWDTSNFVSRGMIRMVPEPSQSLLCAFAVTGLVIRRRRGK